MKLLDIVTIFFTMDIFFMCVSDNILTTELHIINNKLKQKNESKYFSEQNANDMDQVRTDISNGEITSPTVKSSITSIQFNEKQNVPEANEESHILTKGSNTSEISSNFRSNSNSKNSNFSHSHIDDKSLTYESSENNSFPRMEVESKFRNNYVETKLFGMTKHQERNKSLYKDLNTITTETALPDIWYDTLKGNFSCSIQLYEDVSISCSNISMYEISVFLPNDIVTLDISNCLQIILLKPLFPHLKKLRSLKLINNHHRYITRAFMGLESLEDLDLSRNNIMVVKDAFTYIPLLKSLNLTHNSIIRIGTIASALKTLTHFENLTLDGNTDIRRILKNDLEPLKNTKLMYLSLFNTTIEIIEKNAFYCLPYLKILDLSVNYVNEFAMANVTSSLNNTSIKFLFLRNLVLLNSFPYDALKFLQNTTIFRLDLGYNYFPAVEIFPYIPSLVSLWLPRCSIQDIKSGAFKDLPNLKELVLNNHELIGFPSEIARSINLEVLDLHHQIIIFPYLIFNIKDFIFENMTQLEQLNLAHVPLDPILSRYAFFGLYKLKLLSLGATMLETIHEYAFETLKSLLILDLRGNNLRYLKNYTFFGLRNLRQLYLSRNNLIFVEKYLPFHPVPLLNVLYIDENKIDSFPNQIFSSLTDLKSLFLSKNKIVPWNSKIFHPNLTIMILGLSENQITYITPTMLTDFGQVSEYLDLRRNPFNCSACGMEDFQAFFRDSNLTFSLPDEEIDDLLYTCVEPVFLQNQPLGNVELPVVNCEVEEAALIGLLAIAIICFITLFIMVILLVCFYFRWYVRYWVFHVQAKMKEKKYSCAYEPRYDYDAFLSYNSANTPWVVTYLIPALEVQEPKFKLCVHERDFQVGSLITENILEAIEASRKVILILSESFIKSEWCMFELHMAQHKLFDDTRDGLILVKLENINKKLYTKNLLYLEKTRLCLEWTENTLGQKLFWERMRKALGPPISNKCSAFDAVIV